MRRRLIGLLATSVVALSGLVAGAPAAVAGPGQPIGSRPAVVRGSTWLLRDSLSAGSSSLSFEFGAAGDRKLMADWNGDGTRTPGTFRGGTWRLLDRNGPGGVEVSFSFGMQPGDVPVAGDWNGDGIETVGIFRAGVWHLRNTNSAGGANLSVGFGAQPGDVPVPGDWNGDGFDTIGIFRAGGSWHLRDSNSGGASHHSTRFGLQAGDVPLVGDWDRDGDDSIGIFRAGGTWHLRDTIAGPGTDRSFTYGRQAGDVPLVWGLAPTTVPPALVGGEWTRLPTTRQVVALTIDAGGNADGVDAILATLRREGVAATFFLTGQWAERFPQQAAQIGARFPIGNHTYSHPSLPTLPDGEVRSQITTAADRIRAATAQDPRPLFRFPFGDRDARTIGLANSLGYGNLRWTVDTLGWQGTSGGQSAQTVVNRVLSTLQPGQIVLMHAGSHPQDGSTLDADALPIIIRELRARGYGFTTVRHFT